MDSDDDTGAGGEQRGLGERAAIGARDPAGGDVGEAGMTRVVRGKGRGGRGRCGGEGGGGWRDGWG